MKKTILKCVAFVVLYITIIALFVITFGKGPINWRNASNFPVPDTVYIHDTVKIIAPTPTSETFLWYDTVRLERADKNGQKEKVSKRDEPKSELKDSAHLMNEVSKLEQVDSTSKSCASHAQVTDKLTDSNHFADSSNMVADSVAVVIPITQRVYKDSTCTVWVSGYNPTVDSVHVYRSVAYYPVVSDKEYEPPNIVVSIGPYMGFGNKGFNYGIALTVGVPIQWCRKDGKFSYDFP